MVEVGDEKIREGDWIQTATVCENEIKVVTRDEGKRGGAANCINQSLHDEMRSEEKIG